MTTNRPYRGAMSESEALREIRSCSGTQFDPEVAHVMQHAVVRNARKGERAPAAGAISPPTAFAS
jgi:HD-GYP domain-containing protein (c-di-GMP phosphodiesterase class II)